MGCTGVAVSCSPSEGCQHLEYLNLSWCDQITKDGVEVLVRGCRGLRALLLRGCTQVRVCSLGLPAARHWGAGPCPLAGSTSPVLRSRSWKTKL